MIGFILSTETWFYRRVLSILVPSDDSALKASEVLFILKKVRYDNDLKIKFSETAEFLMIPWSLYGAKHPRKVREGVAHITPQFAWSMLVAVIICLIFIEK